MARLTGLIKFQKWKVDEQRRAVADAEAVAVRLNQAIENLVAEIEREKKVAEADPQSGLHFADYIKVSLDRKAALERQYKQALKAVDAARDVLRELFEELKRYEIAEEQRIEAEEREAARLEGLELDEIASQRFEREKAQGE